MPVPPRFGSVSVAPNESQLEIRLLECSQTPDDERKWLVKFEVLSINPVFGPQFASVGKVAEGFCFESLKNFHVGECLNVCAEYIGGAHNGVFQLSQPKLITNR